MGVSDEGFSEKAAASVQEGERRVQIAVTLRVFGTEGQAYRAVSQVERWLRVELGERVESVCAVSVEPCDFTEGL